VKSPVYNISSFPMGGAQTCTILAMAQDKSASQVFRLAMSLMKNSTDGQILETIPGRSDLTILHHAGLTLDKLLNAIDEHMPIEDKRSKEMRFPIVFHNPLKELSMPKMQWDLLKQQVLTSQFTVSMFGFLPGFIYCSSPLDIELARKSTPVQRVPAGSVGLITGSLGIYSVPSPAGWNIIGEVPLHISPSDFENELILPDDVIKFEEVSQSEQRKTLVQWLS